MTDELADTLRELADAWREARETERKRMALLTGLIASATQQGMTEADIVRATGMNRVTVRKAMGKDRHRDSSADSADDDALRYTPDALADDLAG